MEVPRGKVPWLRSCAQSVGGGALASLYLVLKPVGGSWWPHTREEERKARGILASALGLAQAAVLPKWFNGWVAMGMGT